jgi:hypothetical protein
MRLAPTWVPRSFCIPGRRIKLDPRDYYSYGANRGGIDERWFSSTTKADNGPLTTADEGLSYVIWEDGSNLHQVLLVDAVSELGADLLGKEMWDKYGKWPMYSKFFDNRDPLPHHLHQREEHAKLVGMAPKPEAYFFPPQVNNHGGTYPHTFFGLEPGTTKDQVRHSLEAWNEGDNKITNLSKAMRLEPGTGWYVPAGLLHAPGSLCTYEPQWASDVFSMFQSLVAEVPIAWELCVKNVPDDKKQDYDYLVSMVDWEANTVPNIKQAYFRPPVPVKPMGEMHDAGYEEKWITYGNEFFAAKELTVMPGRTVTIKDAGAFGFITMQGHGTVNNHAVETPALIRFGQLTYDEYFVSDAAAHKGVTVSNQSKGDSLVLLKHFGPNPESPQ